jgi:hypothetical protein
VETSGLPGRRFEPRAQRGFDELVVDRFMYRMPARCPQLESMMRNSALRMRTASSRLSSTWK